MRVITKPLAGEAAVWDPADPKPFAEMAGEQFLGQEGDSALVRTAAGCVMHAHPGWTAIRIDGHEGVTFTSADAYARQWEQEAA